MNPSPGDPSIYYPSGPLAVQMHLLVVEYLLGLIRACNEPAVKAGGLAPAWDATEGIDPLWISGDQWSIIGAGDVDFKRKTRPMWY